MTGVVNSTQKYESICISIDQSLKTHLFKALFISPNRMYVTINNMRSENLNLLQLGAITQKLNKNQLQLQSFFIHTHSFALSKISTVDIISAVYPFIWIKYIKALMQVCVFVNRCEEISFLTTESCLLSLVHLIIWHSFDLREDAFHFCGRQ